MTRRLTCACLGLSLGLLGCTDQPAPDPGGGETETETETGVPVSGGDSSDTGPMADGTTATTGAPGSPCPARRHTLFDGDGCGKIAIGDLDADGVDDLLVFAHIKLFIEPAMLDRRLYSYLGTDPLLAAPEVHCCFSSERMRVVTLLDVNGDGRQDPLVTAGQEDSPGDVGKHYNDLEQLVRGPQGGYLGRRRLARLEETFDGTWPQAAVGNLLAQGPAAAVSGELTLALYQADGIELVPTPEPPLMLDEMVEDLVTIDLDGDGLDEVAALLKSRVVLVESPGDGSLTLLGESTPPVLGPTLLRGDLDGAGLDELVIVGPGGLAVGQLVAGAVQWTSQELIVEGPVALADVDADGDRDLLTTLGAGLVAHLGAGDGTFSEAPTVLSAGVGDEVEDVGAGDFDGDGTVELVVCDGDGVLVVEAP